MESAEQVFAELYRQHYAPVHAYATRRVAASAIDDVVSESFTTAWRRLDEYSAGQLPWLYGVARKVISNSWRADKRWTALVDRTTDHWQGDAASDESVGERVAVLEALESLSPDDTEILMLVGWEGLSTAEVAASLECSVPTAKVRLHRARRRLESHMRQEAPPGVEVRAIDPHHQRPATTIGGRT